MKYTEKDFQDYAAGNFVGDKAAFEKWLKENPEAGGMLKRYDNLFTGLKNQSEYKLSFSLEDRVMQKLQARTIAKKSSSYVLNGVLIIAIVAALIVCWRVADFSNMQIETGLFAGAALVTLCFTAALHWVELNRMRAKFDLDPSD